jgi:1-acyl-sn-glycerol-3-phosphate acyltransferase
VHERGGEGSVVSDDTLTVGAGVEIVGAHTPRGLSRSLRAFRAAARLLAVAVLVGGTNALARVLLRLAQAPESLARTIYGRLAAWLVRLLGVRVELEGRPPEGLSVIVANHRSYVDVPLVMSTLPSVFLAKVEIGGWPLFGTAARLANTIFVDRDDPGSRQRAFAALGDALDRGQRIVVFPEGTTSTGPGCLPFRAGAFRLAAVRDLPVVPVAIAYHDLGAAWVDDSSFVAHFLECFRARRLRVSVAIGSEIRGRDAAAVQLRAEQWIRGRLAVVDRASA